jgi:KaiC/GvpD/RAD55 family RecA-like ATPase
VADESPQARPVEGRVSTGNPGLDAMLEGGLVPRRPYLIVGPSGTGKTTMALQFLAEGARRGEHSLLVTLEEPPNEARVNHRALQPHLDAVEVFDAIPDIMRYERVPFKDIASVRAATPFRLVPQEIRHTPELSSVEVTITALEQMLRTEVLRRNYTRVVIDSLTALQYFCMKGFDPVAGAQTFLRFLSDLHVTTLLTVESPLEDADTPERMLARGEIRLFRWELDGVSVRAIGVEKFRGSPHDVRLHPYRIGPRGIDINLDVTISRDTRQLIEPLVPVVEVRPPAPVPPEVSSLLDPLSEEVHDLIAVGVDISPVRIEVEEALGAVTAGVLDEVQTHLSRATALTVGLAESILESASPAGPRPAASEAAFERIRQRSETARAGVAPTELPPTPALESQLRRLLTALASAPSPAPPPTVAPSPPEVPATLPGTPLPPTVTPVEPSPLPTLPTELLPVEPVLASDSPPPLPTVAPSAPPPEAPSPPGGFLPPAPPLPIEAPGPSPGSTSPEPPSLPSVARATPEPVSEPPGAAPPTGALEPTVAKKRRRAPTVRKKVAREPAAPLTPAMDTAVSPVASPTGALAESVANPAAAGAIPPKPKRRAPRKKKAPTVVAASIVTIPPGAMGGESPPAQPTPETKSEPGAE